MNIEYPLTVESAFYGTASDDVIQEKMRVYITMSWGDTIIVDDDMSINRIIGMLREQHIPNMYIMVVDIEGVWRQLNTYNIGELIFGKKEDVDTDEQ